MDAGVILRTRGASRSVSLADYLDAAAEEAAAHEANAWIKSLRHARVDGVSFRERFTYLGDSLWWFAELYLHKQRTMLSLFRAMHAARSLLDREAPDAIIIERADPAAALVLSQAARARCISCEVRGGGAVPLGRALLMDARGAALLAAALASPRRPSKRPARRGTTVAAFVHRAFWRGDASDGSAESYIGPVLEALERRLPPGTIAYVGLGPSTNFRARRWWRPGAAPTGVAAIETLVPRTALAGSSGLWAARHAMRRAFSRSEDIRRLAIIDGCDCWTLVRDELAGVALLQFPWSARAMDESGAALDALEPAAALTYAEAGGWGRALVLEARRRKIPIAGLQHGFIYRHWLNYLHEPDEMQPASQGSSDRGFPLPDRTLVFDEYAARHLREAGHFPADTIAVAGSPRLDRLAAAYAQLTGDEIARARQAAGAGDSAPLVLLVTKYSEVRAVLGSLLDAVQSMPGVQLAIKTHPAETPDAYARAAAGLERVRVLPASAPLAPLLRACRALVTVNSTVALDGLALGIPALSIGLPNNLSPFVEAGAIAGAERATAVREVLERVLYDQEFRERLSRTAAALVDAWRMRPDGTAAERSASAVLALAGRALQ